MLLLYFQQADTEFMLSTETMPTHDKNKHDEQRSMRSIKIECVDESKVDPESVLKLKLGIWPKVTKTL